MRIIRIVSRVLFAIGLVTVVVLSLISLGKPAGFAIWDKAQHAAAYAALAFAGLLSFPGRRAAVTICLALFALGALLELVQMYLDNRVGSFGDAAANGVGVMAGLLGVMLLARAAAAFRRQ